MPKQKKSNLKVAVSFWGVRGSIPSHDIQNTHYGGHTACVALHFDRRWFVLDAGTGIRRLGKKLGMGKEPIALFLSHLHWDHIFGLPFFKPLYQRGRKIFLAGPSNQNHSFKDLFRQIMKPPFFPIEPGLWKANIKWLTLKKGVTKLGSVLLEARQVIHHGESFGFKAFFPGGKKIIYVTDQELNPSDKKFAKWIEGADLLIHDSQYDRKRYAKRKGWGHSAYEVVLQMAIRAKVKRFVLFHHDPDADDRLLQKRLKICKKVVKASKSNLKCYLAKEGSTLLV